MDKWRLILVTCFLVLILSSILSCDASPSEVTESEVTETEISPPGLVGTIDTSAEKVTLEEASRFLGVSVPIPNYLPEGYEIQEIYVDDNTVRLIISDEAIDKVLANENDSADTHHYYTFQCRMIMSVRWFSEGKAPPVRLPVEKVKINEITGFLEDRGDHNALWWNWNPDPEQEGMFEIVLSASKRISKEELLKIARSVQQ